MTPTPLSVDDQVQRIHELADVLITTQDIDGGRAVPGLTKQQAIYLAADALAYAKLYPALSSQPDRTEEPSGWIYEWTPHQFEQWATSISLKDPRISGVRRYRNVRPLYATPARPEVSSEGVREEIATFPNEGLRERVERLEAELKSAMGQLGQAASMLEFCHRPEAGEKARRAADRIFAALSSGNGLGISSRDHDPSAEKATPDGAASRCPEKAKPGGCQLPNVHCRYPECEQ